MKRSSSPPSAASPPLTRGTTALTVTRAGKVLMLHRVLQNVPRTTAIRRRTDK